MNQLKSLRQSTPEGYQVRDSHRMETRSALLHGEGFAETAQNRQGAVKAAKSRCTKPAKSGWWLHTHTPSCAYLTAAAVV
jgi:hypothetical protein